MTVKEKKTNYRVPVKHEGLDTFCFHRSLLGFTKMIVKSLKEVHKHKGNLRRKGCDPVLEARNIRESKKSPKWRKPEAGCFGPQSLRAQEILRSREAS